MCYKSPGPRCASYTRKQLNTAQNSYSNEPSRKNFLEVQKRQAEHDVTLGGQKELVTQIEQSDDDSLEQEVLAERIIQGRSRYEAKMSAFKASQAKAEEETKEVPIGCIGKPIITEPSIFKNPDEQSYHSLQGVDVRYTTHCPSEDGHDNEYDDGYCRDRILENIQVKSINSNTVMKSFFSIDGYQRTDQELPQSLIDLGQKLELDKENSYDIKGERDYYGEELSIELKPEKKKALLNWYYSQPNAQDEAGALEYCRGKGLDTTGKNPDEAVRDYLIRKHGGKIIPLLENAQIHRMYHGDTARLRDVSFDETHPDFITPGNTSHTAGTQGIILGSGFNRNYNFQVLELLDGHENVRKMWDKDMDEGNFIFLTREREDY